MHTCQNEVIRALPPCVREHWCAQGQLVRLNAGEELCTSMHTLEHLYLPTSAVISWMKLLESGDTTQLVMVGREGLLGLMRLLGHQVHATHAVVQCSGLAWRVPLSLVHKDYDTQTAVRHLLLQQLQLSITQMSQLTICNRFHTLDQQLCRLLLMTSDRLDACELPMTHEQMAGLLGARREGVSNAVGRLMRAGLIKGMRGRILIRDRANLHHRSCECYDVISATTRH